MRVITNHRHHGDHRLAFELLARAAAIAAALALILGLLPLVMEQVA